MKTFKQFLAEMPALFDYPKHQHKLTDRRGFFNRLLGR